MYVYSGDSMSGISRVKDWSLITGRVLQNGKIAGPKPFAPPPPLQDRVKCFAPRPFKELKLLVPSSKWLKLQATVYKTTPKLCMPPFSMAKKMSGAPFHRGKT